MCHVHFSCHGIVHKSGLQHCSVIWLLSLVLVTSYMCMCACVCVCVCVCVFVRILVCVPC